MSEDLATLAQRAMALRERGLSPQQVAERWRVEGVPMVLGVPWTWQSIDKLCTLAAAQQYSQHGDVV
jgi:hypothetical protein